MELQTLNRLDDFLHHISNFIYKSKTEENSLEVKKLIISIKDLRDVLNQVEGCFKSRKG